MDMELHFLIRGSSPEPYEVALLRVGNDLRTTCTCQAGQKGMYCKHRLALLRGDYSAVVSNNCEELKLIPQLLANTDVAAAMENVNQAEQAGDLLARKYPLRPAARRRAVEVTVALQALESGGLMKGTGGPCFLDIYDSSDRYCGSLKTSASIFMEDIPARLGRADVIAVVRTDRQIHDRSQGLYVFLQNSPLAKSLTAQEQVKLAKLRLKQAMR